jgi:hypothetical protein
MHSTGQETTMATSLELCQSSRTAAASRLTGYMVAGDRHTSKCGVNDDSCWGGNIGNNCAEVALQVMLVCMQPMLVCLCG